MLRRPGLLDYPVHDQLPAVLGSASNRFLKLKYESIAARVVQKRGGVDENLVRLLGSLQRFGEQSMDGWLFRPSSAK